MADALIIPYAAAATERAAAPTVTIDRARRAPLRLSDGPYLFPEPPDLFRLPDVAAQLAFLREHLQSLCGFWDRPARLFLDAYFQRIAAATAEAAPDLVALAARTGLFAPSDWSFAALRPLPQARLLDGVRVDFAFWTGAELVAIELAGSATPRRQRRDELARLVQAGVVLVEVPGGSLQRDGARLLAQLLPSPFDNFWQGVTLPASPFAPPALAAIQRAGDADQSSA